jgi:hypothetical protein
MIIKFNPSTPQSKGVGLPSTRDFGELSRATQAEGLGLPAPPSVGTGAGRQGLTLHFDGLTVLSLPNEAASFQPALQDGGGAVERVNLFTTLLFGL